MNMDTEYLQGAIAASSAGDSTRFKDIYEHLVDRVFAYVRSRVTSKTEATDIVQEVFVELWQALPRFIFHSREQFYAFVFVIARRKLAKHYAQQARAPVPLEHEALVPGDDSDPEKATRDALERALAHLDPETREIVTLHHWARYTFKEIGACIHKSESAVRVQHHRALKILATQLNETYHGT